MTESKKEPTDAIEKLLDKAKPIIAKISFGGVMGYCSGTALKKVGKALAFVIGCGFIGLQVAVSSGYIDVDWNKVRDDAVGKMDSDKDGKLTAADAKEYWKKLRALLTNKIPGAGGFGLGFLYGVKHG
jgi:uncharacterized membrane protein (Fun14 family)